MTTIRLAVAQHACVDDIAENSARGMHAVRQAAARNADILLLPELHAWPYFCISEDDRHFDTAQTIPGALSSALAAAAKSHRMIIVTTLFERRGGGVYHNTAVVFDRDGNMAGRYRKMHIPQDPGFCEKFYFAPGDQGFAPVETSLCSLGVLVCWDQWFPEAARLMALADAELLLYPSAIGWDLRERAEERVRQLDAWLAVQRAHAIANALPVAASNRVGVECAPGQVGAETCFWGNSFIVGCQGEPLVQAETEGEQLIVAELDLSRNEAMRRVWPFFRDRRIDHYQGLLERHRAQND